MEGSSSSGRDGKRLPPVSPRSSVINTSVAQEEETHESDNTDASQDPVQRRRAASREYSQRHRLRQQVRVNRLEEKHKNLVEEIADNSSKVQYYQDDAFKLAAENNSLKEEFTQVASDLESQNAEAEVVGKELEELKLIKEAQEDHMSKNRK